MDFFGNVIMNKDKTLVHISGPVTSAFWEDELTDEVGVIATIRDTYRSPQKLVVESKIVCSLLLVAIHSQRNSVA